MAYNPTTALVDFQAIHIDEDCTELPPGNYYKQLFHNCTFKKLNGVVAKDCTLTDSKVLTDKMEDALGLTVTLDCKTFDNLELSPLMFDLFVMLLIKTKGNEHKRKRLIDILGRERIHELLSAMKTLE